MTLLYTYSVAPSKKCALQWKKQQFLLKPCWSDELRFWSRSRIRFVSYHEYWTELFFLFLCCKCLRPRKCPNVEYCSNQYLQRHNRFLLAFATGESNDFFGKKPLAEIVLIIEKGLSVSFSMPVAERVVIVATLATSHNKWPSICSFRQVLLSSGAKRRCKPSRRHHWCYLPPPEKWCAYYTFFLHPIVALTVVAQNNSLSSSLHYGLTTLRT